MGLRSREILKGFFEKNDLPTQAQFIDLIDSVLNFIDDGVPLTSEVSDELLRVISDSDNTKKIQFLATLLSTGITRQYNLPDISGIIAVTGMLDAFSFGGQAHGGSKLHTFSASKTFLASEGNIQEMPVTATTTVEISGELPGMYAIDLPVISGTPTINIGASFGSAYDNTGTLINADGDINTITLFVNKSGVKKYTISTITA